MFQPIFDGDIFSYYYETETDQYLLLDKKYSTPIILKDNEGFMFKEHIALINTIKDNTLNYRIEKVIEIHFNFATKPCPMPHFVEE